MKPREFWIDYIETVGQEGIFKEKPTWEVGGELIHVREVMPIDWDKVFAGIDPELISLKEDEVMALKFEIKRIVEKQLAGEW